jgi:hypothetical protein
LHQKKTSLGVPIIEEEVDNQSNPSFFNSSKRSSTYKPVIDSNAFTFNKEIESGFKSAIYMKMDEMIM